VICLREVRGVPHCDACLHISFPLEETYHLKSAKKEKTQNVGNVVAAARAAALMDEEAVEAGVPAAGVGFAARSQPDSFSPRGDFSRAGGNIILFCRQRLSTHVSGFERQTGAIWEHWLMG
jgi:hypothetical protein